MNQISYRTLNDLFYQDDTFTNKRIFLRADLNVPLDRGKILDDYRLEKLRPTLDALLQRACTVTIATHLARPSGIDPALSTKHLIPWFIEHGYAITFADTLEQAYQYSQASKPMLVLLENVRFFAAEKSHDKTFASQLASLGDYYVCDAFASLHRDSTSLTDVAYLFKPEQRAIGFLIEKELAVCNQVLHTQQKPFVLLLGGGKVADKIPFIMAMLDHADTILLGPAIVFSFLHAQGKATGASLVDEDALKLCLTIMKRAREKKVNIIFPVDYMVSYGSFSGPCDAQPVAADALQKNMVGMSIGPGTVTIYTDYLQQAGTIVVNGLMGTVARPETITHVLELYRVIAQNNRAIKLIGGGDSVAAAHMSGHATTIGYLSTGGGALLAFLSGQKLPGLLPFVH